MVGLAPLLCALASAAPAAGPSATPFSVTASTATTSVPRVLLAPTWAPPASAGQPAPSEAKRAGFARYLHRAARRRFEARGLRIVPAAEADRALTLAGSGALCRGAACLGRAAAALGASHWLGSLLIEEPGHCAARVVLYDVAQGGVARRIDDRAGPCTAEQLLGLGRTLGERIAAGPNLSRPPTLALTPRTAPELNIPDLPDLEATRVATSSRAERSLAYGQALEIYELRHLKLFEQDGDFFLAQQDRLLTECDAWRIAWSAHHAPLDTPTRMQAPLPRRLEAHCYGNHWEWAWLGVPTGVVIAWGSWGDLRRAELSGVAGFTLGLVTASVGAGLALALDEDDVAPEDAKYFGSRTEIEALVADSNAALRARLELSDADVLMAGMRL